MQTSDCPANNPYLPDFQTILPLQHLPYGVGAVGGEYLIEVGCHAVVCHRAVTHHEVIGLLLGNGFDGFLGHIAVETGNQIVVLAVCILSLSIWLILDITADIVVEITGGIRKSGEDDQLFIALIDGVSDLVINHPKKLLQL